MKSLYSTLTCISLLLISPSATFADEEKAMIPNEGLQAIGALGSMSSYIAHTALGRIADAPRGNEADLLRAAQDAGGIKGGLTEGVKYLKIAKEAAPEGEAASFDSLVNANELAIKQADALIALIGAEAKEEDVEKAKAALAKAREACAQKLTEFGIPMNMLK